MAEKTDANKAQDTAKGAEATSTPLGAGASGAAAATAIATIASVATHQATIAATVIATHATHQATVVATHATYQATIMATHQATVVATHATQGTLAECAGTGPCAGPAVSTQLSAQRAGPVATHIATFHATWAECAGTGPCAGPSATRAATIVGSAGSS